MLSDNRYYWERFGRYLYLPLNDEEFPKGLEGFAGDAAKSKADLQPLTKIDGETEWLRAPGWHFFLTYSGQRRNDILRDITLEELKDAFCEGKDPYEREQKDACTRKTGDPYKPIEGVAKRLSGTDHESKKFWYPVMLYLALLLKKTNFTTLE